MPDYKKKRSREDDEAHPPRKHKRSKSHVAELNGDDAAEPQLPAPAIEPEQPAPAVNGEPGKKKRKKKKRHDDSIAAEEAAAPEEAIAEESEVKKSKSKSKKSKDNQFLSEERVVDSDDDAAPQVLEITTAVEEPPAKKSKKSKKAAKVAAVEEPKPPVDVPAAEEEPPRPKKSKKAAKEAAADERPLAADLPAAEQDVPRPKKNKKAAKETAVDEPERIVDIPAAKEDAPKSKKSKKVAKEAAVDEPEQALDMPTADEDAPRPKKSKKDKAAKIASLEGAEDQAMLEVAADEGHEQHVSKKSKKQKRRIEEHTEDAMEVDAPEPVADEPKAEHIKHAKKSKKEKRSRELLTPDDSVELERAAEEEGAVVQHKKKDKSKKKSKHAAVDTGADAMDLGVPLPAKELDDVTFPFFTQTVSLYLPLYPVGFGQPITNICKQHLDPMLNHFSHLLHGVPLAYRNVNLGEFPQAVDPSNPPTDETTFAKLQAVDEYAVGFGYVTADFDLFMPSRGAWMEGRMNLQTDGHIGLVCFEKFNASVEAKRLPAGWKWIEEARDEDQHGDWEVEMNEDQEGQEGEGAEGEEGDNEELKVSQLHSNGYWVDERGNKVTGKIRFRIQAFDAGMAGDFGFLSIRGTMLSEEDERALTAEERAIDRARRNKLNPYGLLRPATKRLPEYSMTKFAREEVEDDSGRKVIMYKGSRPQTPD